MNWEERTSDQPGEAGRPSQACEAWPDETHILTRLIRAEAVRGAGEAKVSTSESTRKCAAYPTCTHPLPSLRLLLLSPTSLLLMPALNPHSHARHVCHPTLDLDYPLTVAIAPPPGETVEERMAYLRWHGYLVGGA